MRQNAADLGIKNADQLPALGHLDFEQAFDGDREGVLLVHRRNVVEPIEIRHGLKIGLRFDQLLGAAMQQADMRVDTLDDFAVELKHEPQNAMRGRVLRAEVDVEVADGGFRHTFRLRDGES